MLEQKLKEQAKFVRTCAYEALSEKTLHAAKLILLDSIGCIAAGLNEMKLESMPSGKYPLVGKGIFTERDASIYATGTAMVRYELDEGNQFAFGHPACHIIPALLAECVEQEAAPKRFFAALAAAYEVTCRWSAAVKLNPAAHVHGTAATVGSAIAACRFAELTENEIYDASLLALSLPQCTTWKSAFHGDQLRNAYVGISNIVGGRARYMNKMGVFGSIETVKSVWSEILGSGIREEALCKGLGEDWLIEKNYFKVHTACRYTHAFADMGLSFLKEGHLADEIKDIKIETYGAAAKLSGVISENAFAARFSIPVALSILLLRGNLNLKTMTDENVKSNDVLKLAEKITVLEKPEYTAMLPEKRMNKMLITLKNGETWGCAADKTRGDYTLPFKDDEIIAKFISLTSDIWDEGKRELIINTIFNLEREKSMSALIAVLG